MSNERILYERWRGRLADDPALRAELDAIQDDEGEIRERFYRDLSFGTAGLRGILGVGTNRMNVYTVRRATQGLAKYLRKNYQDPSAAIAYDSRIQSDVFAREAACVLATNGVKVHLYRELMPTPALSYAVRELGCDTGIVVTASHNPAAYNGYKVYGPDGCQIGPDTADEVLGYIGELDYFDGVSTTAFDKALGTGMVEYIPDTFVEGYIDRVYRESVNPGAPEKAGLKLVYTPLNGAGRRCVLGILARIGQRDVTVVPSQEMPDGNFPTCPYPNPETPEALVEGLKICRETGADMLLATDPDADRVAVAVRDGGDYRILSGNEAGILLLDYIAASRRANGTMPKKPVAVKSIVSSKLADKVAAHHGVEMVDVLTGFKFIGEVILSLEQAGEEERFIFGFEESCGYLSGGYVRDKDAVDASMLLVEMAAQYKLKGKTLCGHLEELYRTLGVYKNVVEAFAFEGADGMQKMREIMSGLRAQPPVVIAGDEVVSRIDYKSSTRIEGGRETRIDLPASDVLEYGLASGSAVIIRPSGTEPKIKIYYSFTGDSHEALAEAIPAYKAACARLIGVR